MKVSYEIKGVKELQGNIQRQIIRVRREAKRVVLSEAEEIMLLSLAEVPRGSGALADSAFIEPDAEGNVDFGYGGPNVQINPNNGKSTEDYMVRVHEDLSIDHLSGKAKFLEDPINKRMVVIEESFAKKLKRAFNW